MGEIYFEDWLNMKTKIEPCEGCGMTAMDEYADPNLPELCVDCVDAMEEE